MTKKRKTKDTTNETTNSAVEAPEATPPTADGAQQQTAPSEATDGARAANTATTPSDADASKEPTVDELQATIAELQAQVVKQNEEIEADKDRYLRLNAEFDNYRKRTLRERAELIGSAAADTLEALLPVVDDFDRAVAHLGDDADLASTQEGMKLIHHKLLGFLKQQGVEAMEAIGQEFDTDYHDAISQIEAPKPELKGKIVDEVKRGYLLRGKVLRHAQVVVGK